MIYGIGIDLVDTVRMEGVIKRWGGRFTNKVFTTREVAYCERKRSPAFHYAVRFAAKESFFKALGRAQGKRICWKEVEVMGKGDKPPSLGFSGVTERRIKALGVRRALLSLSHGAGIGVAQVILEG